MSIKLIHVNAVYGNQLWQVFRQSRIQHFTKFYQLSYNKRNDNLLGTKVFHTMSSDKVKADLRGILNAGIGAVLPRSIVENKIKYEDGKFLVGEEEFVIKKDVYLVGFGKAVMGMAIALERILGETLKKGIISVPKGSGEKIWETQDFKNFPKLKGCLEFREGAANNMPDGDSLETTIHIMEMVKTLREEDTLMVLVSGGGSALLFLPKPPLSSNTKQQFCKKLQNAGADIKELNIVRKSISLVKGGGLAKAAYPASVIGLVLSDIIGDPIDLIASGPTVPNKNTPEDVIAILKKYKLYDDLEEDLKAVLISKEVENQFDHVKNIILANNQLAIKAAEKEALKKGLTPITLCNHVQGLVQDVSKYYTDIAELVCLALQSKVSKDEFLNKVSQHPTLALPKEKVDEIFRSIDQIPVSGFLLIGGGEPTVVVSGPGKGGRNQELSLYFSMNWLTKIHQNPVLAEFEVILLSAGTDGQDGPTDAAGAFGYADIVAIVQDLLTKIKILYNKQITEQPLKQDKKPQTVLYNGIKYELEDTDPLTLMKVELERMRPENTLQNNDSYNFYSRFKNGKDLVKTGLTGTNVMDLHFIYIAKRDCECTVDLKSIFKCPDPFEDHNLKTDLSMLQKVEEKVPPKGNSEDLLNIKILDKNLTHSCCTKQKKS
ncbi:glycerate kinase [Cephus cinctus]|uniref:Glycerate kinase n=1 Tax=Cephus cinctus TaxID=211228 RepID=A0AAJ7BYJ6_CEPCN|nr:glycerate kinase [Cephus cinctus]